jgi:hypothetical protein
MIQWRVCGVLVFLGWFSAGCTQNTALQRLQARTDSLELKLQHTYKPGLGELMIGIQTHHAKLFYAAAAGNWDLAAFETDEIAEMAENAKVFCADRPEVQSLPMIVPALERVKGAVKARDYTTFKGAYINLTNTCNSCHKMSKFEFIKIKEPDVVPVGNQEFRVVE